MSIPWKHGDSHFHRSLSLDALRLCIRSADQRIVVLAAPSGFGKTELARAYCESHPDAEYVRATEPAVLRRSSETKVLFVDEAERLNGTHQRSLRTWQIWFLNSHPNAVLVLIAQNARELLSRGLLRKPICLEIPSWIDERAGARPVIRPQTAISTVEPTQAPTPGSAVRAPTPVDWLFSHSSAMRQKLRMLLKRPMRWLWQGRS